MISVNVRLHSVAIIGGSRSPLLFKTLKIATVPEQAIQGIYFDCSCPADFCTQYFQALLDVQPLCGLLTMSHPSLTQYL